MSPDEISSLFPDRPIRPLPTRRLREKLPPDVAHLIKFPPSSPEASLFQYPAYSAKDDTTTAPSSPTRSPANQRDNDTVRGYWPVRSSAYESLEALKSASEASAHPPSTPPHSSALPEMDSTPRFTQRAPVSTASSVDGYDSFENTNNKKKRKIPAAGDLGHGAHSLSNDIDALSISGRSESPSADQFGSRYYSSITHANPGNYSLSAPSFSGSGRGRLGRAASGRSPLRTLSDSGNVWSNRNLGGLSDKQAGETAREAPKTPLTRGGSSRYLNEGQENMAAQQPNDIRATPTSSQFTFTCDSSVPGTIQWPAEGYNSISGELSKRSGYQPNGDLVMPINGRLEVPPSDGSEHVEPPTPPPDTDRRPDPEREQRRERRRANQELKEAARQRKQAFQDDVRVGRTKVLDCCRMCEFCEYEAIFGEPPRFLIREFEERERDKKRAEADKKRLLEKARAKARKKRNGKNQAPAPATAQAPVQTTPDAQETQSEEDSVDNEEYRLSPGDRGVRRVRPGSEPGVAWRDPGD